MGCLIPALEPLMLSMSKQGLRMWAVFDSLRLREYFR